MARRMTATTERSRKTRSRRPTPHVPHTADVKSGTNPHVDSTDRPRNVQTAASGAVEPEALVVTHWFDSGEAGDTGDIARDGEDRRPYSATIRLAGRRVGVHGNPKARDSFTQEDKVDGVVPGSGPVSVTTWVYGLQPGEWTVTAHLVRPGSGTGDHDPAERWRRTSLEPLQPASWSWRRWSISDGPVAAMRTRMVLLAPLARIPAVLPGSFPLMAVLGILSAFITQSVLAAGANLSVGGSVMVSLLGLGSGLIGAKVWYAVLHPGPWRQSLTGGWSVDGFLVVAPIVVVTALVASGLPIGVFLDVIAPGLFFAVAIGRLGCFLTGCCAGHVTSARWGVWSSDRRVGARRVPTQLMESVAGLLIGIAAALPLLFDVPRLDGSTFVAAFVAYMIVRQFLLRLRAERREYSWRRSVRATT